MLHMERCSKNTIITIITITIIIIIINIIIIIIIFIIIIMLHATSVLNRTAGGCCVPAKKPYLATAARY